MKLKKIFSTRRLVIIDDDDDDDDEKSQPTEDIHSDIADGSVENSTSQQSQQSHSQQSHSQREWGDWSVAESSTAASDDDEFSRLNDVEEEDDDFTARARDMMKHKSMSQLVTSDLIIQEPKSDSLLIETSGMTSMRSASMRSLESAGNIEKKKKKKKKKVRDADGVGKKKKRTKSEPIIPFSSIQEAGLDIKKIDATPLGDGDEVSVKMEDSSVMGKPPIGKKKKKTKSVNDGTTDKKKTGKEKRRKSTMDSSTHSTASAKSNQSGRTGKHRGKPKSLASLNDLDSSTHSAISLLSEQTEQTKDDLGLKSRSPTRSSKHHKSTSTPNSKTSKKKKKKSYKAKAGLAALDLDADSIPEHDIPTVISQESQIASNGVPTEVQTKTKDALAEVQIQEEKKEHADDTSEQVLPTDPSNGISRALVPSSSVISPKTTSPRTISAGTIVQASNNLVPSSPIMISPMLAPLFLHNSTSTTMTVEEDLQRQEILRLQHQLSEALQKVVTTTEEHITDKGHFLQISTDLTRLKSDFTDMSKDRDHLKMQLDEREAVVENSMMRIDKLEEAIERQLDEQDRLEIKLEHSEDEIEKLLIEIQDLESAMDNSKTGNHDDEALRTELKEAKKQLVDKQREIDDQKTKIAHLTKELADTSTVNKLQVDELEEENTALQGKLKGERLDLSSKLTKRDEMIVELEKQLRRFKSDSDAQDVAAVRDELTASTTELEASRNEVAIAQRMLHQVKQDREELIERNNILNSNVKILDKNVKELSEKSKDLGEKVLQWTEKTYEWKSRAESAEKRAGAYADSDAGTSDAGSCDEAPQGLFLQAVMDKKAEASIRQKNKGWRIFHRSGYGSDDEDLTPEEIRIKELERRNDSLEESIAELQSDIVKMQTTHKEESYSTIKKVRQLEGENDALLVKNATLEQICGN